MDLLIFITILLGFSILGLYLRHLKSLMQSNNESYDSRLSSITDTLNDHNLMFKSLDIKMLDDRYEHLDRELARIRSEIASLKIEIEVSQSMSSHRMR